MLTVERLKEVLCYEPDTGILTWRIGRTGTAWLGSVAGNIDAQGYLRIGIDGARYKAHRLAWMYEYGRFPERQIDHVNGNRTDNRITNLRDVSQDINQQNRRRAHVTNASGLLGVGRERNGVKRWRATIGVNGESKYLGLFKTPEAAHAAYLREKRKHHPGCTI